MSDFNTIDEIIADLQQGRMVVLVDERDLEVDGTEVVGEGELMMVPSWSAPRPSTSWSATPAPPYTWPPARSASTSWA